MRCNKCNEVCYETKTEKETIIACCENHHKIIQYLNGSQLEIFETAEVNDTDSSTPIKIVNHTLMKKVNRNFEKHYFATVFLGPYFLFRSERLLPSGSDIFQLPEFNAQKFSGALNMLDVNYPAQELFPESELL